jgi:hypothetical protein
MADAMQNNEQYQGMQDRVMGKFQNYLQVT